MNDKLKESVCEVLTLLVEGRYSDVEVRTHGVKLKAAEMAGAITDYGRQLVLPPEGVWQLSDIVEIKNVHQKRWFIAMPLWTREEGRSDLTIEMTVIEQQNGFTVEVDDIHVL